MDKNKVTFGLSNVHIAFVQSGAGSAGVPAYDTPKPIPGAVGWTPAAETNEYKFHADNSVYYATFTDNGYKGDLEVAKFPDEIIAEMFGWIIDEIGGLVELADGKRKDFALLAQIDGDVRNRRLVYYKCGGGKPSQSHTTTTEGIEVQTQKMPVIVMPIEVTIDGETRKLTKYVLERDAAKPGAAEAYDKFFENVYISVLTDEPETTGGGE